MQEFKKQLLRLTDDYIQVVKENERLRALLEAVMAERAEAPVTAFDMAEEDFGRG